MTVARLVTPDLAAIDGVNIVPTTEPKIKDALRIKHWFERQSSGLAEQKRQIEEDS